MRVSCFCDRDSSVAGPKLTKIGSAVPSESFVPMVPIYLPSFSSENITTRPGAEVRATLSIEQGPPAQLAGRVYTCILVHPNTCTHITASPARSREEPVHGCPQQTHGRVHAVQSCRLSRAEARARARAPGVAIGGREILTRSQAKKNQTGVRGFVTAACTMSLHILWLAHMQRAERGVGGTAPSSPTLLRSPALSLSPPRCLCHLRHQLKTLKRKNREGWRRMAEARYRAILVTMSARRGG